MKTGVEMENVDEELELWIHPPLGPNFRKKFKIISRMFFSPKKYFPRNTVMVVMSLMKPASFLKKCKKQNSCIRG